MLDINKIRNEKEALRQALLKRVAPEILDPLLDKILKLDSERRELLKKTEELKAERNKFSKTKPTPDIIAKMKKVGEEIKKLDEKDLTKFIFIIKENLKKII